MCLHLPGVLFPCTNSDHRCSWLLTPDEANQFTAWSRAAVATQTAACQPISWLDTFFALRVTMEQNNNSVFMPCYTALLITGVFNPSYQPYTSMSFQALITQADKGEQFFCIRPAFCSDLSSKRSCGPTLCSAINPNLYHLTGCLTIINTAVFTNFCLRIPPGKRKNNLRRDLTYLTLVVVVQRPIGFSHQNRT